MAQLFSLSPEQFRAAANTNFPQYFSVMLGGSTRSCWAFDSTVSEKIQSISIIMPVYVGQLTLTGRFAIATTSGNIQFRVECEAISIDQAINTNTANNFDSTNNSNIVAVHSNSYYNKEFTVTLANKSNVVAGDMFRFTIDRHTGVASNATGDCFLYAVEIKDES